MKAPVVPSKTLAFFVALSALIGTTYGQYWPPNFAVTRNDAAWLTYAYTINQFDSASVTCTIGEFAVLRSGRIVSRVGFEPSKTLTVPYTGGSATGVDATLADEMVTSTFVYATGDTLRFHRALGVSSNCSVNTPPTRPTVGDEIAMTNDGRLTYFNVGTINSIADTSIWVTRLMDAEADTVLAVIDSVGIRPNGSSVLAQPYGSSALTMNRKVALPTMYAGREVYLKVHPERYGQTRDGMSLSFIASSYSLSSCHEYLTSGYRPVFTDSLVQSIEAEYLHSLVAHYDSVLRDIDCVPELETSVRLANDSTLDWFLSRYFDNVSVDTNGITYVPRACSRSRSGNSIIRRTQNNSGTFSLNLFGDALAGSELKFRVQTSRTTNGLRVQIFELPSGKLVHQQPVCTKGELECYVVFPPQKSGAYKAVLSDPLGQLLSLQLMVR